MPGYDYHFVCEKFIKHVTLSHCFSASFWGGRYDSVHSVFVASGPSTQWLNIWVKTFYYLFNLPLKKRHCVTILASRSGTLSPYLSTSKCFFFLTPPFLTCCYGDLAASCVTRHYGNKTTKSCVFVWQWYEGNLKQRYPFLLPESTDAFPSESSTLAVRWPWHYEGLPYNRPPP